jgi:hypothetical protein
MNNIPFYKNGFMGGLTPNRGFWGFMLCFGSGSVNDQGKAGPNILYAGRVI